MDDRICRNICVAIVVALAVSVAYAAPVIVLAAGMLVQLILYAHRVLLGFVVLSLGLSGAAVTLGVLELLLVAGSLAVLAGQTTSNP